MVAIIYLRPGWICGFDGRHHNIHNFGFICRLFAVLFGRFGISGLVIVSRLRVYLRFIGIVQGQRGLFGFQTLRSLGYRDPKDDARAKFDGLSTKIVNVAFTGALNCTHLCLQSDTSVSRSIPVCVIMYLESVAPSGRDDVLRLSRRIPSKLG